MDKSDNSINSETSSLIYTDSELDALQELCATVIQSINVSEFLQTLIERAGQILHVKSGSIVMPDQDGYLRIKAYFGFKEENAKAYALKPNEGRGGKIFVSGKSQIFSTPQLQDIQNVDAHQITWQEQLKYTIGSPMVDNQKKVTGVLFLNDKKSGEPFNERDLKLLENLANLAAIAVEKQSQLEELNHQKENYRQLSEKLELSINQLNSVNDRLRESNKLKDEVLSICAHDVRSPLTSIISYAELLLAGSNLTDKQQRYLNHIYRSSEKINSLVQNLLVRARYLESTAPLRLESVSVSKIAREAFHQLEDRLGNKKIHTAILEKWAKPIRADRFKLAQVIDNLVDNAVKFTPEEGEIKIEICLNDPNKEMLTIIITNSGEGIPSDSIPRLFLRYFQVTSTKTHGGYGLGLAICKQNVEAHGGEIIAESVIGKYTAFRFTLPIGKPILLTLSSSSLLIEKINLLLPKEEDWQHIYAENDKALLDMISNEVPSVLVIDADVGELNLSVLISLLRKEFDKERLPIVVIGSEDPPEELLLEASFLSDSSTFSKLLSLVLGKH